MWSRDVGQRIGWLNGVVRAAKLPMRLSMMRVALVTMLVTGILLTAVVALQTNAPSAAAVAMRISAAATCGQLAGSNPSVTNGSSWGKTILPGHGAPGGWFGVDVCSNGVNSVVPNGSNVSCSSTAKGCVPTTDGYGWTFQCPELIVRFSAWAFGDSPSDWGKSGYGNAPDLWLPVNHPSDWVMYPNGSSTAPVPGDILIWGNLNGNGQPWPAGVDGAHGGHIAVVAAVHGNTVITAEQNVKWGSQDHPSDTLALTRAGTRWILSGSSRPATTLPTYRWQATMGNSRGTYGWLHNIKNNGHFPTTNTSNSTAPKSTAPSINTNTLAQQFPGGLPSLSTGTVVTQSGTLADLTWSTQSFFSPAPNASEPATQVRSLGIPPGNVRLESGQTAATITMSNGSRYSYVIGADGNLYSARTSPDALGVFWSVLNRPTGVFLMGSPVASLFAGGVAVAVRGNDGNLWWLAGPADHPGNWVSLGAPAAIGLTGGLALVGAPGAGTPVVFVIGTDGRLYTRVWQDAVTSVDGTQLPAAWSEWFALGAQPSSTQLHGALLAVPELPAAHDWIGPWPDSPIDLFAADSSGTLWWFRSTQRTGGWKVTAIAGGPKDLTTLLGGVAVAAPTSASRASAPSGLIQLYATSRRASYMVTVRLPGTNSSSSTSPTWMTLTDPPAGVDSSSSSAAIALGPGNSVLVTTAGDELVLGGAQAMTAALAPNAAAQVSGGKAATNAWVRVGAVAAATTFSDTFNSTHLDSRWTRTDPSSRVNATTAGMTLMPGTSGVAALTQAAQAGNGSLAVQVSHPEALPAKGSVGLVLYADDADWLTLTVDRSRTVSLCAARQAAQSCLKGKAPATASLWLRVERDGSAFIASVSGDGVNWQQIGQWAPLANGSTKPSSSSVNPTATIQPDTPRPTSTAATPNNAAPTVAPLAFTTWGVLATGDGQAAGWPTLSHFTVS